VNEERYWREIARLAGLDGHVVLAALGVTIAHGEDHGVLWRHLGVTRPPAADDAAYAVEDLYPDALPCLREMRNLGLRVGVAGNQSAELERWTREANLPVDIVGSSASWGCRKPEPAFFERMVADAGCLPAELAYVGDRVDNDVVPALEAGIIAVHLRRGPWGLLQESPPHALVVHSLAEVSHALASLA
jgi:HAD superfamily hydrolase (TIGR01662 family)